MEKIKTMNEYQTEQLETLTMIRRCLESMDGDGLNALKDAISAYLVFRHQVAEFLNIHFADTCTRKCYRSRLSACCSRDGIITFLADSVINALNSSKEDLDRLKQAIKNPADPTKCIYLSQNGCAWNIKPVVCEFFLCDEAEQKAFEHNTEALHQWEEFKALKKTFTWPDRPVIFETLERYFIDMGCDSPLMYMHKSPGLMKIRNQRDGVTPFS